MKVVKQSQGFTLIELVVVIVILGILAATAAPRFIDLTGDARASVMEAVEGSINSAMDLAHAKALVDSQTASTGSITVAGTTISLAYGYPTTNAISSLLELDAEDVTESSAGVFQHTNATTPADCQVEYVQTDDVNDRPELTGTYDGC
ncbi:type II secretion system protein [Thalassotalea fusca]